MARFKKGQSGNPKGKPPGTKSRMTKLREAIESDLPAILAALVMKAKDGDVGAANLLLSRCLPPLRPQSEVDEIPVAGSSLAHRAEAIATSALAGELSPTVATEMMAMLGQQARILETAELADRIERLEAALAVTKGTK